LVRVEVVLLSVKLLIVHEQSCKTHGYYFFWTTWQPVTVTEFENGQGKAGKMQKVRKRVGEFV